MSTKNPIPLWRSDEDGNIIGYYIVEDVTDLEAYEFIRFPKPTAVDCSRWGDDAYPCEKKEWKGCCCVDLGGGPIVIPPSCRL